MKIPKINVLVSHHNDLFRLFSVMHGFDSFAKEPYLKIVVPSIKNEQAFITKTKEYIQPTDQDNLLSGNELELDFLHELSFHYEAGVIHFKNNKGAYIGQKKLAPIKDRKLQLLSRIVFNDLEKSKKYNKLNKGDTNLVLELPFNELGRLFEVYLSIVDVKFNNEQDFKYPQIGQHVLRVSGLRMALIINEHCYFEKKIVPANISFSWLLPNEVRD